MAGNGCGHGLKAPSGCQPGCLRWMKQHRNGAVNHSGALVGQKGRGGARQSLDERAELLEGANQKVLTENRLLGARILGVFRIRI